MTTISTYISFNGQCREAMTFYKECIGGDLTMQTVEGSPAEAQCPPAIRHQILHSSLVKGGIMIMGSDMLRTRLEVGNNVALCLHCGSEEEINTFFTNLAAGGQVVDPLKEQFWGAMFGELTDKYGIRWMFNYDRNSK